MAWPLHGYRRLHTDPEQAVSPPSGKLWSRGRSNLLRNRYTARQDKGYHLLMADGYEPTELAGAASAGTPDELISQARHVFLAAAMPIFSFVIAGFSGPNWAPYP
jgi:hypothetical protein